MREAFLKRLGEIAQKDRDVILISADMTGENASLFQRRLPGQYINSGIAEQNSLLVAAGLALSGKIPYVYSIAPFVTTRIHEFLKHSLAVMNIPVTILGVGAGFSYEDSGPTHHTLEDIALMRALPNMRVLSPSDQTMSAYFAEETYRFRQPTYVRLDRQKPKKIYPLDYNFVKGFTELREGENVCIVATGNMVANALEVQEMFAKDGKKIGVIDLYQIKPLSSDITRALSRYKKIISIEEHFLAGGMGSLLAETIMDGIEPKLRLRRMGVNDQHNYEYGGRANIQDKMGIGVDALAQSVREMW